MTSHPLRTSSRWSPRSCQQGEGVFLHQTPQQNRFSVPIWDIWTQEAFLIHVQQAKSMCKWKGLFKDYYDALEVESKSVKQVKSLWRAIAKKQRAQPVITGRIKGKP